MRSLVFALGMMAIASCLPACGAAVTAQVDTADRAAGVTVDGWGVSASCKGGHVCVQTPVAPICFPVPSKVCAWLG